MIVTMTHDIQIILIKLTNHLHNIHTLKYLKHQKQVQKTHKTLKIYAPLAHKLDIHKLKWKLEDLAFQTLHPRKYAEIEAMIAEHHTDREEHVHETTIVLTKELNKIKIPTKISNHTKHF